ncbi:EAL domain-containing protein [Thalassolituus sp. LLYu03]|uniref:EAL domain-containing protein n=1 Tax=Thalassolituus sp. LLYu03 TaxID=3421656 RepID=UPI003D28CDC3
MANDKFEFAPPRGSGAGAQFQTWKVLTVEDDATYQASLVHSLKDFTYRDAKVQLFTASSAAEAAAVLAEHPDMAVMLLDVVMETDDAGLRLVGSVREVLGNATLRIVLLTGQPGMAPRADIMHRFDVDEYWNKSDLSRETLHAVLSSHLRTWYSMTELQRAQQGLQMIIDASRSLMNRHDYDDFTQHVLDNIAHVVGVKSGGIVCASKSPKDISSDAQIIAASGNYSSIRGQPISDPAFARFREGIDIVMSTQAHLIRPDYSILYFETASIDGLHYLVMVDSDVELTESKVNLLRVFSENIRSGFTTVALLNRLSYLAYFDERLGLSNRNGLLRELISMNSRELQSSVLLLIGIRSFRDMTITLGEHYTNLLLVHFCERITERFPHTLQVANLGEGRLALLFHRQYFPGDEELGAEAEQRVVIEGVVHHLLLSFCTLDLADLNDYPIHEALHLAEASLSRAMQANRAFVTSGREQQRNISKSFMKLQKLQQALLNDELALYLQPKVELESGDVTGLEALVRWIDQDGTVVSPAEFIPLADASGLICSLDLLVLNKTIEAIAEMAKAGVLLPVSFNVVAADLNNRAFTERLFAALDSGEVQPSLLEVEITESQSMHDYQRYSALLKRLIDRGVGVSIDDFGTGYSSLAHITRLAATTLKIDQSFVQGVVGSMNDLHVVELVIKIGRRFGFNVIAEGIETDEQRQTLLNAGCRFGQGYLFARPMPVEEFIRWIGNRA